MSSEERIEVLESRVDYLEDKISMILEALEK